MPVYCSAANCYSNSKLNEGMHFYRFPKERERCLLWAQASGRLDLYERGASHLYNNFSLCERHFESNQFMNDKKKRLIWKAIPTIFEIPKSAKRVRRKKTRRATATVRRRVATHVDTTGDDDDDDDVDDDIDLQFDNSRQRLTKGDYIDMPGYCSAPGCSTEATVDCGMHFFRFPKDEDRCKIWIRNSQRFDLSDKDADFANTNCRLCERHFEETQFMNRDTRSRLIWKAVPTLFDFPEISDLVCMKRGAVSDLNACSKRSCGDDLDNSSVGLNLAGPLTQKNSRGSKSVLGKKIIYESARVGRSLSQQVLPSVRSVVQSAKQLGMKEVMADFFEEQLQKCLEDEDECAMSSTKDSEAAAVVAGAEASLDESSLGPKARVIIQQCLSAKLLVRPASEASPELYVQINRGIIVYICLLQGATSETVKKLARTVLNVRLSEADDGKMVSVLELPGEVLIIPQATLGGRIKGNVMQYHKNIDKTVGEQLYSGFVRACQAIVEKNGASIEHGCGVLKGTYGNRQVLSVETNGPYSHIIEA